MTYSDAVSRMFPVTDEERALARGVRIDAPPRTFGDPRRWLIEKHADGQRWLLHEPISFNCSGATVLPSFASACALFRAYSNRDREELAEAMKHYHPATLAQNFEPRC
jgi:hypothetical protein